MSYSYSHGPRAAGTGRSLTQPWAPRPERRPVRATPLTRRYEISWLTPDGVETATRIAPAAAPFEEAFAAFARGTLIATRDGPVAVEDLVPGQEIMTADGGAETLLWLGSMTLFPKTSAEVDPARLVRLTADCFGLGRPMPDLVLGPHARILLNGARLRSRFGLEAAFAPVRALADGVAVIEVAPVAPITVFHLMLPRQAGIRAAGMEIESYHPGPGFAELTDPQTRALFFTLFPHVDRLDQFGAAPVPRLTRFEAEEVAAG